MSKSGITVKSLSRGMIRALLKAQNGRCAISNLKIKPSDVSLDHIIPISRKELSQNTAYGKGWLVHKRVNALKGALTLDELYEISKKILSNKTKTLKLKKIITSNRLIEISKKDFDNYIKQNYNKDGSIKK